MTEERKKAIRRRQEFRRILRELLADTRLKQSDAAIQHGSTSVLRHSMAVALYADELAEKLHIPVHREELLRGALLHDYFLYDWHKKEESPSLHGFKHPYIALKNAQADRNLSRIEADIIKKHMFPLTPIPPRFRESAVVCLADKVCSTMETLRLTRRMALYKTVDRELRRCLAFPLKGIL